MTGETRLTVLLRTLSPERQAGEYVYASLPSLPADIELLMAFREQEGWAVILRREVAEQTGMTWTFPCAWISLRVHSSLQAVGLTAAVADALAGAGIACNTVAAYHHDHVFVPPDRADEAIDILRNLARS